jgi:hypothetical protein
VKPAIQKGSGIPLKIYSGLLTKTIFEKVFFKLSDSPQLSELFKLIIFNKPFLFKCSLFLIISKHCLNNKKSINLAVTSGYFSKCFIIICNSLNDSTL